MEFDVDISRCKSLFKIHELIKINSDKLIYIFKKFRLSCVYIVLLDQEYFHANR